MDMVFSILRLGMFYQDWPMVKQRITDAKKMFEEGADWERKNRLKASRISKLTIFFDSFALCKGRMAWQQWQQFF